MADYWCFHSPLPVPASASSLVHKLACSCAHLWAGPLVKFQASIERSPYLPSCSSFQSQPGLTLVSSVLEHCVPMWPVYGFGVWASSFVNLSMIAMVLYCRPMQRAPGRTFSGHLSSSPTPHTRRKLVPSHGYCAPIFIFNVSWSVITQRLAFQLLPAYANAQFVSC